MSGLLLLTLGVLTIRTAFTLATGNTLVYFLQPVFADLAVAAIFLGSLWTARPNRASGSRRQSVEHDPLSATIVEDGR